MFCFDANLWQTKRSLDAILRLKRDYIHPYVKANMVIDYTLIRDRWYYDRENMQIGILAPFHPSQKRVPSPFEIFFVWWTFSGLWNIPKISRVVYDLDWRKAGWVKRQTGFRDRSSLLMWVATTSTGVAYCSQMMTQIRPGMFKKYPSDVSKYLVCANFDEWVGYLI
jgi:hypothetical protein